MFERIHQLLAANQRPDAIDLVYDTMDEWLLAGDFGSAREAIRQAAEEPLPKSILMSFLIVSAPWKGEMGEAREYLGTLV
jgi:hypothetical protein